MMRLLLVDGDGRSLAVVEEMLAASERELVRARSGAEALAAVASQDFEAIVVAAEMPVMDGFETAAKLKAVERARHVPIILVSAGDNDAPHRERAERLQREFVSTLGQELRAPLNAMLGRIRMLRDGSIGEAQRARALAAVERSLVTQLEAIEEMIDVSRMASGNLTLELGTVDLRLIVAQSIEAVRPSALEKQVTLVDELEGDVAHMSGDGERLRQVVQRLVRNAVNRTPTDGVVAVSLCNVGARVEVVVADTASAIEEGVDMAIVRHLVALHDGTIRVEREPPLSRFVVSLPAEGRTPRTDDEVR